MFCSSWFHVLQHTWRLESFGQPAGRTRRRRQSFPQTSSCIEVLEDRIVLSPILLTAREQLLLELVNRARSDPEAEADRYGIDLNEGLSPGTISSDPKQPLAPNQLLLEAARGHSDDMLERDFFSHTNPDGEGPGDRITATGYSPSTWGENISWRGSTGALDKDASVEIQHEALFLSPGHRTNILYPDFHELGPGVRHGVFTKDGTDYNASMITENFGSRVETQFITGVVYEDTVQADLFYTIGEGVGNITVTAEDVDSDASFTVQTGPSGGYALELPTGTYNVTASGDALDGAVFQEDVVLGAENQKVNFRVTVETEPLDIFGTVESDTIQFEAPMDDTGQFVVTINGSTTNYDASQYGLVNLNGAGGAGDQLTIVGSSSDEWVKLSPNSAEFHSFFDLNAEQFHTFHVESGGGSKDRAVLHDSPGDDLFRSEPNLSTLEGSGYFNQVSDFPKVYALADNGGSDTAYFFDSAGYDKFAGHPGAGWMIGSGFYNYGRNFSRVYAFANNGGGDVGYFYDSANNDKFVSHPGASWMVGSGFYNYGRNFARIYAFADKGGYDTSYFYDSSGYDRFVTHPNVAWMDGDGFYNYARGFETNRGYGANGGGDLAYFYDSSGDDAFTGQNATAKLEGPGFRNEAYQFARVYAYSNKGGTDTLDVQDVDYVFEHFGGWS